MSPAKSPGKPSSPRHTRAASTPRPRKTVRLPDHVLPERVDLHLDLDPRAKEFRGEACYALRISRSCRLIELHSAELATRSVELEVDGTPVEAVTEPHPECETLVIRSARSIPAGAGVRLRIAFRGRIRDDLRGLYRGSDEANPWIASQLCPTDARRLFPCFDEPGIKTCYAISVTAPAGETVISNAPIERRSRIRDGMRTTTFEETPPLSSYLIAVAVGPFEASRAAMAGKTPIRVYTLPGQRALGRFARTAAVESLTRLERWFGLAHPYAKLDLLALPDFAFGAMENAGAVFFRDSVLLLDPREASAADRLRAAETIAHELAHMWFGNLVTMAWWNDLWLNESFATWMAFEIVHDWRPEWRIWLEFIARRESALELDALASSHPIAPPIRTAEEAHQNFDAITYTKGASVLRMLERYVGARVFRDGVRRYVRSHREGAATAADLWRALEDASGVPIEKIVGPWTMQTGYPVVRATRARDGNLRLEQERFLTLPRGRKSSDARWAIPWIGRLGRGRRTKQARTLLTRRRGRVETPDPRATWLYGNAFESGFFRIDHGEAGHARLLAAVGHLDPIERIGWIGHQWALTRAGVAPLTRALEIVEALGTETDPDVLFAIERVLIRIAQRLIPETDPATGERFGAFIERTFGASFRGLPFDGSRREDPLVTRRRARLISILGGFAGADALVSICAARALEFLEDDRPLPHGAEEVVLRVAARSGERDLQKALLAATRNADTPQSRRRALFALVGFETGPALDRSLRASLDSGLAPAVDRATLLMSMLSGPRTAGATWTHLRAVWPRLEAQMPPILLARLAGETANALPVDEGPRIRRFFERHRLAAGTRVLDQIDEELQIAKRLTRHARQDLIDFLAK